MAEEAELSGRAAIVTGASRGIGRAIAERLARAGAGVVLTARHAEEGEKAAAEIREAGGRVAFVQADAGDDSAWMRTIEVAEADFGGVDVLVLNAGVSKAAKTLNLSLEDFRENSRVNLKGVFLGLKHGAGALRRRGGGGSVVMVASIVGKIGVANHIHYVSAKAGVRLLAKAAALELGPEKIRVNTIHPGFILTEHSGAFPESVMGDPPLQRGGEPGEVAEAALFLASDRSEFMTGAEIVMDGGWTAR